MRNVVESCGCAASVLTAASFWLGLAWTFSGDKGILHTWMATGALAAVFTIVFVIGARTIDRGEDE